MHDVLFHLDVRYISWAYAVCFLSSKQFTYLNLIRLLSGLPRVFLSQLASSIRIKSPAQKHTAASVCSAGLPSYQRQSGGLSGATGKKNLCSLFRAVTSDCP